MLNSTQKSTQLKLRTHEYKDVYFIKSCGSLVPLNAFDLPISQFIHMVNGAVIAFLDTVMVDATMQ